MSERLTQITELGTAVFNNVDIGNIAKKLCDLEDKIEQGKIVELPCNVGDKIFAINACRSAIYEYTIRGFWYNGEYMEVFVDCDWCRNLPLCTTNDIGKGKIFLDRAEAEAKLRKWKERE